MNEKSEKLLKKIYSIDTEAGHRFRYHVMKAEVCPKYAKEIDFKEFDSLAYSFQWASTSEGHEYWFRLWNLIVNMKP